MVIFEVLNLVFGSFGLTTNKTKDYKETFTKNRFSKYCNQKSHQGVKDRNFAKIVLDFTLMVIFEVLNLVSGGFGLTKTQSTDCKETFTKNRFSKYCNRKSHQGVKDRNFAEIVLDFTSMVIFLSYLTLFLEVLVLVRPKVLVLRKLQQKKPFFKILLPEVTSGCQKK